MDQFDKFRVCIAQNNCPIVAGVLWMNDWTHSPDGMIPKKYDSNNFLGLHAVKVAGWKEIFGEPYLVVQNSWGQNAGDNGLFYFNREISNRVFIEGALFFSDDPNVKIQRMGLLQALLVNLVNLLTRLNPFGKGRQSK